MVQPERDVGAAIAGAALVGSPDGFVVVDGDLCARAWNPAAERLLGYTEDEVLGRPDPTIPDELRERDEAVARDILAGATVATGAVLDRVRKDGSPTRLLLRAVVPVELDDGPAFGVFFSAATGDDAQLQERNLLSRELASAQSEDEVVETVTRSLRTLTAASHGFVLAVCPSGAHLHGHHALGTHREVAEQIELGLDDGTAWSEALAGRVAVGDLPAGERAGTAMFVPMGPPGSGTVLALVYPDRRSTGRASAHTARSVADETWVALQRAQLVSELAGKVEILEATAAVASAAGLELDATLDAIARHAALALSCERSAIYLRQPDGSLELAHLYAVDLDTTTEAGARTAREALERGEIVIVQDATTCDFLDGPWHHDVGAVAVMAIPLRVADRDVGSLVVAHTDAHPRGFTNLCQQVGSAVAQQTALAVEHARLYADEQANVRRLTELDELKRDYIAGITHDLKTPLTGLLGFVNTLRRLEGRSTPEQQRSYLDIMQRQAERLVSMVEDLLLAARAEDGAVAPTQVGALDLRAVVEEALEAYSPAVLDRLDVVTPPDPAPVRGDRAQLVRVVQNVVDNALKYAGGTSQVRVEVEAADAGVALSVRDRGVGIDPAERERVFERFGLGAAGVDAGSTGLGLFISRSIARGHGGDLVIETPTEGPGTIVRLRLPRAEDR